MKIGEWCFPEGEALVLVGRRDVWFSHDNKVGVLSTVQVANEVIEYAVQM